jgi:hypothetical protein
LQLWRKKADAFVPGKHLKPIPMLAGEATINFQLEWGKKMHERSSVANFIAQFLSN